MPLKKYMNASSFIQLGIRESENKYFFFLTIKINLYLTIVVYHLLNLMYINYIMIFFFTVLMRNGLHNIFLPHNGIFVILWETEPHFQGRDWIVNEWLSYETIRFKYSTFVPKKKKKYSTRYINIGCSVPKRKDSK